MLTQCRQPAWHHETGRFAVKAHVHTEPWSKPAIVTRQQSAWTRLAGRLTGILAGLKQRARRAWAGQNDPEYRAWEATLPLATPDLSSRNSRGQLGWMYMLQRFLRFVFCPSSLPRSPFPVPRDKKSPSACLLPFLAAHPGERGRRDAAPTRGGRPGSSAQPLFGGTSGLRKKK